MTAGDPTGAHPASADEPVLLDRLFRIPRTGRLVSASARQPGEQDAVEPDRTDPDPTAKAPHLRCGPIEDSSPLEQPPDGSDDCVMVGSDDRRPGDDEDVPARLERGHHHPEHLTEPPPDPVSDHRAAELSARRQPETGHLEVRPQESCVEERVGPRGPETLQRREVLRAGDRHEPRRGAAASVRQTVSRFRPRTRRAASTRRPPVVFIRDRKPCSFARWRFLGW